jgi:hypothetical protein
VKWEKEGGMIPTVREAAYNLPDSLIKQHLLA